MEQHSSQDDASSPSFQDGVAAVLMQTEELRQQLSKSSSSSSSAATATITVTPPDVFHIRHAMEELMSALFSLKQPHDDDLHLEEDDLMRQHCQQRAAAVALQALKHVTRRKVEADPDDPQAFIPNVEQECQGAIARMAELTLVLHGPPSNNNNTDNNTDNTESMIEDIVTTYASYQRQVLRQRAKPSIARLVAYRKRLKEEEEVVSSTNIMEEMDEDGTDSHSKQQQQQQQHAHVLTTILGQASALIHPLMMWQRNIPDDFIPLQQLCTQTIATLDEQAQSLTQTVATWCMEDWHVDDVWMTKSAQNEASTPDEVAALDAMVEELAFACQVMDRYIALVVVGGRGNGNSDTNTTQTTNILVELHPEWTWKYASLEQYLTMQQLQSALSLANPVPIVVGTPIQVPSVVEDAQYLSRRALERAASTRSTQAIGTVAHALAQNVWSTELRTGTTTQQQQQFGVYAALVDQKGCWQEPPKNNDNNNSNNNDADATPLKQPTSSSFASALLGAFDDDDDLQTSSPHPPQKKKNKPPSAPSSGNTFLGSLSSSLANSSISGISGGGADKMQHIRMDTYFCALNGIHSASAACASLVGVLDSLLPENNGEESSNTTKDSNNKGASVTMIQLAREELFRYSKEYQNLLQAQVERVVFEFCGSLQDAPVYKGSRCIPVLRYYLERENYQLANAKELQVAEEEPRLHQTLIAPLQDCRFLQQFAKCDGDVLQVICQELVARLVDLVLDCITSTSTTAVVPKRFTDWGSLLLSKQVRTLQSHISTVLDQAAYSEAQRISTVLPQWERLSQAVTVLQLEKPSDWVAFYQATSVLSTDELEHILKLRVDFSSDAVAAVVASVKKQ
jgi:hypothetical protein